VAEGTAAGCHMTLEAQILEERWQSRGIQRQRAAEHTPQIQDVTRRCLEEVQVRWREVDVINIAILNVIHVLIVRDAQGQNAAHHGLSVHNVTIAQHGWVRSLHLLVLWIDVVDKGIDKLREVIGGTKARICSCGRLRGEVSSRREIVIASFWFNGALLPA
jgi:hypothetical protein